MSMKDYERFLEELKVKRGPAEARARELIRAEKFEEADETVRRADDSIYGAVALARLYEARLAEMIGAGDLKRRKASVEAVYRQALRWNWSCYPEPHTEYEADDYERGRVEDHAKLVKMMGYDPGTKF
jgi:hypothetical protein